MDEALLQELKDYLRKNLSIQVNVDRGCYGMGDQTTVAIYLEDEKISEDRIS